jgi:hypothetical protein
MSCAREVSSRKELFDRNLLPGDKLTVIDNSAKAEPSMKSRDAGRTMQRKAENENAWASIRFSFEIGSK